jgi:hypothetical protein
VLQLQLGCEHRISAAAAQATAAAASESDSSQTARLQEMDAIVKAMEAQHATVRSCCQAAFDANQQR